MELGFIVVNDDNDNNNNDYEIKMEGRKLSVKG